MTKQSSTTGDKDESLLVLFIGERPADLATLREALSSAPGRQFRLDHADDVAGVVAKAQRAPPAAMLVDLDISEVEYRELKQHRQELLPEVPIVLLSDADQETLAWNAVQDGAQDYLVRGRFDAELLQRVLRHAIERQRLVGELERRVAELEASESRVRTLIERNADGVVILGPGGIVRFVNPAAEKLFGRPAHQLLGELFGHPVVSGETTEIDVVRPGGRLITVELRCVDTTWEHQPAHLLSLRDITDRKRAEQKERELIAEQSARAAAEAAEQRARRLAEENARLYESAQIANRAKANFLAVMSHELRTPLNAIIGYTDLILAGISGPLGADQEHYLDRIRTSSHHLLQLVEEVLTFSRIEAGGEHVRSRTIELAAALHEVSDICRPLAVQRNLEFRVDDPLDPPGDSALVTDPDKLRQILVNLIDNAIKFTDSGAVRLSGCVAEDECLITVSDSGIGIDPAHHETIFDPFWQVSHPSTRTRGGTGLGLTVSRRLARLLGGDIVVESQPGTGATFTVRLPLRGGESREESQQGAEHRDPASTRSE
jgi:signal transduction histidine kinase